MTLYRVTPRMLQAASYHSSMTERFENYSGPPERERMNAPL